MEYSWPLSIPQFSWKDKLKFVKFLLTNDRWTQGTIVEDFECAMADYVGTRYAVFTSSGSTANTLLAMYLQDFTLSSRDTIVFPSTTWITSVSPFAREGFKLDFIDISLRDFSMDLDKLEDYLNKNHSHVVCVFVTSLIGFTPDILKMLELSDKYNVRFMMDNCENTLGRVNGYNISSFFTSTTSTYFGHQIQSVEGGFVFTNYEHERDYFLMARNHGMLRHLPPEQQALYRNKSVDGRFDFHMMGNNFRNTNINAFLGLCDLKRANQYFETRRKLYSIFRDKLKHYLIFPHEKSGTEHAPFCLPIVVCPTYANRLEALKRLCRVCAIETRPIISGNLLRQTCLNRPDFWTYTGSEYLHQYGFYIGLHGSTTENDVKGFCELAQLALEGKV